MEYITIKNPPEFITDVEKWSRKTKANGEEMAKIIGTLLNNELYNKVENERQNHVTQVILTAEGWTGTNAPFSQTVAIEPAKDWMEPILVSALEDGASVSVQKAYNKAFGIISSGSAYVGNGTATFTVYKKPVTNITIGLKGV